MNRLPRDVRVQVLKLLTEGMSMRAAARVAEVSYNTVAKLMVDAGRACKAYHDEAVRGLTPRYIEVDEIWAFCYAKRGNAAKAKSPEAGDLWTWTALDPESRLLVTWAVGNRGPDTAYGFMYDLADRVEGRFQLNSDGYNIYEEPVAAAFYGREIDYAQLAKQYHGPPRVDRRYSPEPLQFMVKLSKIGAPDMDAVTTAHTERHNLTMRMSIRRFTRLTNAFTKKAENHAHMVSLYGVWYNFCRVHSSIGKTPVQEAGLVPYGKRMEWIMDLVEAAEPAPKRGPYKTNISN